MQGREKTYGKDEVVFREGDPNDAAYVVVKGRVELSKAGSEGPVLLAILGPMEIFGETVIADDNPYPVTARAAEKSVIRVVPKQEFRDWMLSEPEAAMMVMGMLVQRLKAAETLLLRMSEAQYGASPRQRRRGLIEVLVQWLRRRVPSSSAGKGVGEAPAQPFAIGVATMNNDIEGAWSRALVGLLDGRPGISVRGLPVALQVEAVADQNQVIAALARSRQVLAGEEALDLLVWGDVHADGYTLYFTAAGPIDDERPGSFSPYLRLELTGDQEPPSGELLYLTAMAAIEPRQEAQRAVHRQLLAAAQPGVPGLPAGLPIGWNLEQQLTGLVCYGHAAATIGGWENDTAQFEHAAEVYRAAVNRLPRGEHGMDEALIRKHLGGVLLAAGERRKEPLLLEQAAEEYRHAAECLVRAVHPQEWAAAQCRLGLALYKLDLVNSQASLLKESITAFQAALQVFTRVDAPQRWADIMHNLAQVLQVYGDQAKNADVLERAVEAARAALEFRVRNQAPLVWAGSQNSLGTALFLLSKHSQTTKYLDEAAAAFTSALEVYRQYAASRQVAVAEKNLAHVQRLKKIGGVRKVGLHDWDQKE